jgi:hypothetical protein
MFEMYGLGGTPIKTIGKEMEKLGLRGTTGLKPLSSGMIYHILRNPFYYGQMRIKKGILKGLYSHKYQPLITKTLFDKCQDVMASYHKKPFQYASKPFIFRGLIKCADCGCTITPETSKGHTYYSCTNYKGLHAKRVYVPEKELLRPVIKMLRGIQLSDKRIDQIVNDLKQTHKAKNNFHRYSLTGLRKNYDLYQKRIETSYDLLADSSITKEMFNYKLKEYKEKQAEIDIEMKQFTQADENYYITASTVLNLAQKALEIFKSSEPMEKRELLNFLLQNPQLKGRKLVFTLKTPFDRVLEANTSTAMLRG